MEAVYTQMGRIEVQAATKVAHQNIRLEQAFQGPCIFKPQFQKQRQAQPLFQPRLQLLISP
jgi:hypothetical protein